VTAPGDGEVTVVSDEMMGEKDPLLARLLAAATAGASARAAYVIKVALTRSDMVLQRSKNRFERTMVLTHRKVEIVLYLHASCAWTERVDLPANNATR
jgi:hypothetical protein